MLNRLKDYFSFTKKEFNGLLVLCLLLFAVLFARLVLLWSRPEETYRFDSFKEEVAAFRASEKKIPEPYDGNYREQTAETRSAPVYFSFDPNSLSESGWRKLGLSKRQARVILNYLSKGGSFRKKEDLKKIYSLSPEDYSRLEPYIVIPELPAEPRPSFQKEARSFGRAAAQAAVPVELNSADSALLETIRGIGSVLASRIVRYRDRLGGFYSKEQLREVYGIDSLRYAGLETQVSADASAVRKLNINQAGFDDLKKHPYLTYKQMNAIIQYRKQHGPYSGPDDLKKIVLLSDEILRNIAPYLTF